MTNAVAPVAYSKLSPQEKRAVRSAYINAQNGLCHHCNAPLDGPPAPHVARQKVTRRLYPDNFFKFPVHLHHSHDTDLTIGAVHNHCNAVLWEHHGE